MPIQTEVEKDYGRTESKASADSEEDDLPTDMSFHSIRKIFGSGLRSLSHIGAATHQEPLLPSHIFMLIIVIGIPNLIVITTFGSMFNGLDNYNKVAHRSTQGDGLITMSFFLACICFIFDWWHMAKCPKFTFAAMVIGMFYGGAVCKGRKYPWAPMLVTLLWMPAGIGLIRKQWCDHVKRRKFYGAVAGVTCYSAIMVGLLWAYYVYAEPTHGWNQETKDALAAQASDVYANVYKERPIAYGVECGPNANQTMLDLLPNDEKADISAACSQAATVWFLSWTCPAIVIGCDMIISVFCRLTGPIGKKGDVSSLQKVLTKFVLLVAFCLAGLYGTATISSNSLRLGSTLMAFFMAALALLCLWVAGEVDYQELKEAASHNPLMQQLVKLVHNEWVHSMAVGALFFPFCAFIFLNCLTQRARKMRNLPGVSKDKLTPMGRKVIDQLMTWNWTNICLKILILSELFFMLQIGVSKATYIFLSWLNTELTDTPLAVVCILVFLIGSTMFLLPPVPGLPVYIFAGILLGAKGTQTDGIGFSGGVIIASFLSLITKLCACVGQYAIGYFLGKSIKVQQLIGVDKVPTRAIEKILKSRGLKKGKVALLVGGPDWPTSVTCGIIGVNIPQMLLGTIPVLTLLVPCILAGACMGKVTPGEDSVWNLAASASTIAAAVVNMASAGYAVYTITMTISQHGDELAKPRKEHEAVAALTAKEAASVECYQEVINWSNLYPLWKIFLVVITAGSYFSNVAFVVFAERCFRTFALSSKITDSYEDNGLRDPETGNASAMNIIIAPYGYGALFIFFMSSFFHFIFLKYMARKTKKLLKSRGIK